MKDSTIDSARVSHEAKTKPPQDGRQGLIPSEANELNLISSIPSTYGSNRSNISIANAAKEASSDAVPQSNQSNLPPWLRTQSAPAAPAPSASSSVDSTQVQGTQNTPNALSQKSSQPSLMGMTSAFGPAFAGGPSKVPGGQTVHPQPSGPQAGGAAAGPAAGPAVAGHPANHPAAPGSSSSSNLTATAADGLNPGNGQLFLPVMAQNASLPMMAGGSLIPNSQPNSSFVRTAAGPMINSAAHRAVFSGPGGGLLGGNMQQEYYQQFNAQQGSQMQYGTLTSCDGVFRCLITVSHCLAHHSSLSTFSHI